MAISLESLMSRSEAAARSVMSEAEKAIPTLPSYKPTSSTGADQIEARGVGLILQTAEQSLLSVGTAVENLRKLGIEPLTATKPAKAGDGK
jgi:hypothetical protein